MPLCGYNSLPERGKEFSFLVIYRFILLLQVFARLSCNCCGGVATVISSRLKGLRCKVYKNTKGIYQEKHFEFKVLHYSYKSGLNRICSDRHTLHQHISTFKIQEKKDIESTIFYVESKLWQYREMINHNFNRNTVKAKYKNFKQGFSTFFGI